MKESKKRLDAILMERNLVDSREKARRLILAGLVKVRGVNHPKPGMRVSVNEEIIIDDPGDQYVGRGGRKLAAALDLFRIDPSGMLCLDIGSSTGGFTDCLLQRGAKRIYAVDVGYGQLHYRLRKDPRIIILERFNARYLGSAEVPEPIDLAVIDVSFISLHLVLQPVIDLLTAQGFVVVLIKPQFEAGREKVPRGGVIKDQGTHYEVLEDILRELRKNGWKVLGLMPSPIPGVSGNREYLAYLVRAKSDEETELPQVDIREVVSQAFKE
jgi:23S rRNA (cytidine1920-2'-O)/16S rRNA (cytidine1409-2'-O)-methyltransferase